MDSATNPAPNAAAPAAPKRLKIFHINFHQKWGGQPNRVLTETKGLLALGHEVWVAGPRGCMLCERAAAAGARTFEDLQLRRGFRPLSQMKDVGNLRALFERERFDIIHTHGSQDTWAAALALRGVEPRPALVRMRHNSFPVKPHFANRWLYRQFDWIITVTPQLNDILTTDRIFPADRVTPIYSAPDPASFYPRAGRPELRAELGIPALAPVIVMTGRLAPEKGHALLIAAAAEVVHELPETRFLLIGTGRSRAEIEARISELGLGANFVLAGFRNDVSDLVALSDIFTLTPTSGEGIATSALEAFLMEKPAVATDVGGLKESVRHGETGFLIPPGDAASQSRGLAEAYLKLLRDPELRARMGAAGRALVAEEFSPEALARRTLAVYEMLAARPR